MRPLVDAKGKDLTSTKKGNPRVYIDLALRSSREENKSKSHCGAESVSLFAAY